jgi:hypothetical protein
VLVFAERQETSNNPSNDAATGNPFWIKSDVSWLEYGNTASNWIDCPLFYPQRGRNNLLPAGNKIAFLEFFLLR